MLREISLGVVTPPVETPPLMGHLPSGHIAMPPMVNASVGSVLASLLSRLAIRPQIAVTVRRHPPASATS